LICGGLVSSVGSVRSVGHGQHMTSEWQCVSASHVSTYDGREGGGGGNTFITRSNRTRHTSQLASKLQ
jgi:hypothetical protein